MDACGVLAGYRARSRREHSPVATAPADPFKASSRHRVRQVVLDWVKLGTNPWYKRRMPSFRVTTPQRSYDVIVERGALASLSDYVPARAGKLFLVSTRDVWALHGAAVSQLLDVHPLFFPGGE